MEETVCEKWKFYNFLVSGIKKLIRDSRITNPQFRLCNLSPSVFNTWFSFSLDQHNYETSNSTQDNLIKLFYKTKRYGKYSITVSAVESWNKIQKQKICYLEIYPPIKLKQLSVIFILNHINNSLIMQKLWDFNKRNYCNY